MASSDKGDTVVKPRRKWKATFLALYAELGTVKGAAEGAGVNRQYVYVARQRDAKFAAEWDAIEHDVTDLLERTAEQRAIDGSDSLMRFLLEARNPAVFRAAVRLEHGGTIDHNVTVGVSAENRALEERLGLVPRTIEAGNPAAGVVAHANGSEPGPAGTG